MAARLHNPFRELRTRQNISQYELGRRIQVSKHAILRLEQGMFQQPLPSVIDYFLKYFPSLSKTQLLEDYAAFQIQTRQDNARLLGDIQTDLLALPVGKHPLTWLRENQGLNLTELAKRLAISQSTVGYFENRPIHQKIVPEQLIHALWDADYTEQETSALVEAYATYRARLIESKHPKVTNMTGSLDTEGVAV